MGVAKRQGKEKPAKIEQRKVKGRSEDQSEDFITKLKTLKPAKETINNNKKTFKKKKKDNLMNRYIV